MCVHTAGFEGVTRGERAAGRPCEPSHLGLFVLVKVGRVSLWYLSAVCRYTAGDLSLGEFSAKVCRVTQLRYPSMSKERGADGSCCRAFDRSL